MPTNVAIPTKKATPCGVALYIWWSCGESNSMFPYTYSHKGNEIAYYPFTTSTTTFGVPLCALGNKDSPLNVVE